MSKTIVGTENLNNGEYLEATGSDNGAQFSAIVSDFMRRIATHTHNGNDSLGATLPSKVAKLFPATGQVFSGAGNGKWTTVINLISGTPTLSTDSAFLAYFYKETADSDVDSSYKRFYPTETYNDAGTAVTLTLNRNDVDIKVIG